MLSSGALVPLTIEKPAAGGRMIARVDGQVVLVAGAIPGERVTAVIERVAKGVAYATTVSIEESSADRREVDGDPLCGGCLYAPIAYRRQVEIKAAVIADAFGRIARLPLPSPVNVAPSPEAGYRMRARLHVRGRRIGFFREGTHDICDPRQTRQLLPETCDSLERLSAGLASLGLDAGREVELAENIDASERVVYLDAASPIDGRLLERLFEGGGLTGLASANNLHGSPFVIDRLTFSGVTFALRRHVAAFFQGNRFLLPALAAHVAEQVPERGDVLDLYAGSGVFALSAAVARGARVTAVEGDRVAAADLTANAAAAAGAVTPVHRAVEAFLDNARGQSGSSAATVIVDPPRTGLSREALESIVALRAPRLVYVSCDVATLARDARRLADGGYRLSRIDAFDLFPNTPHVETVCVFEI